MNGWRAAAVAAIDRSADDLVAFLSRYVSMPSVNPGRAQPGDTGDEAACQHWLAHLLREWRVGEVDVWEDAPSRPNLAVTMPGTAGEPGVMFNGHGDTVEVTADQREAWDGDPWSGEVRGGALYGRGSVDMKAGNAAFLWAGRVIRELGVPLARPALLTVSIAEETAEAEIGPLGVLRRGYRAPLIVNAEPSELRICPVAMGWMFLRITVRGLRLHPASRFTALYPEPGEEIGGVDAILGMTRVMAAFEELERDWYLHRRHPLMPPGAMGMCPVQIEGGAPRAAMSERCSTVYAVPIAPSLRSADVLRELRAVLDGVAARDTWLREHPPEIECPVIHRVIEPLDLAPDHWAVDAVARSFEATLGATATIGCFPGPCDANIMAEAGETAVICGPGRLSSGAHGTNEHVEVAPVIAACKLYAGLILDRCGPGAA